LVITEIGRRPADVFYVPNGHHAQPTLVEPGQGNQKKEEQGNQNQNCLSSVPWPLGRETPTVLLYSRFLEFRLERIVTLVQLVAEKLPQARWLIVGAGLHGEEIILADKLVQANLSQYVHFTGWLPAEQVPACFKAADVVVYPYDDTLLDRTKCSVKLISLLAAGLAVVADAVGQNCEYIESGVSGLLVPAEDDVAFGKAVVMLLQQPETRQQLGQAAAQIVPEKFSWSTLSQTAEKVYR
jgi:glycosyltransferase involved in cell wall biosynthesis